ncbi:MAG TPA: GNAT family N-acetyltransferase [Bacteroidia bacterium]|nr:GNAT family N-acetyltransferase [Bacteroidia bacterium]
MTTTFQIRSAAPSDIPALLEMIRELAEFEGLLHQVTATEENYRESLFGERPAAEALVAEAGDGIVGYAIFFASFSTFIGRPGIWLEDLYVRPDHRRHGIGKSLLKAVGAIAWERGAGRYEWTVLDWNHRAIDLYERTGAEILPDWRIARMDREQLRTFIES